MATAAAAARCCSVKNLACLLACLRRPFELGIDVCFLSVSFCLYLSLPLSHTPPYSLSLSLSLSLTHTPPYFLYLSLSHTHFLSLSLSLTHTHTHTHKHNISISHTVSNYLSVSLTLSLSLSHYLSLSLSHYLSLSLTHTHTHTHTYKHTHSHRDKILLTLLALVYANTCKTSWKNSSTLAPTFKVVATTFNEDQWIFVKKTSGMCVCVCACVSLCVCVCVCVCAKRDRWYFFPFLFARSTIISCVLNEVGSCVFPVKICKKVIFLRTM